MDCSLPPWLEERARWERPAEKAAAEGKYVLYWLHNAMRGHENPALDAARLLATQNGLPLLIYQGLSEDYPYASDRHHAFMLQGARDVQRELQGMGHRYAFHLQHRGNRGAHLKKLASDAAVIITELMPVEPLAGWVERLVSTTSTPMVSIDASCLVPVTKFPKAYTRAYQFRKVTQPFYRERVAQPYPDVTAESVPYDGPLPFEPLDLQDADLAHLIGRCDIDHSVAPVTDTPGGSRAGYARWQRFREGGLRRYAKSRNDASSHTTSRMSAYLHYGMVSPFRIASEAHAEGAEKYLDEMLIWRELAHHFCAHHLGELDTFDAIPTWAQTTLEAHASDPREARFSWERLAHAHSDHPLWDACQRSLLKHGELHNNVRMTWGKAVLPWVCSPRRALQTLIDLNHRYALDGRSPCSYGGLLWCFGQFDRPFEPDRHVVGTVRPRPVEEHARRINLERYTELVDRPVTGIPAKIAIVGAGIAGLVTARTLSDHGLDVSLFDKSRGVGGRLATRRAASGVHFDHGAQYFTMRDCRFGRYVCSWLDSGLVQPWNGRIVEIRDGEVIAEKKRPARYVGVPAMNSIARHLAADLSLQKETEIESISGSPGAWELTPRDGRSLGTFDYVVLNCPPKQAAALLPRGESITEKVRGVQFDPCWAVLVELEEPLPLDFDGAFINTGPLSWIARDSSKPGRPEGVSWILHASGEWSDDHLEDDAEDVLAELLAAFSEATGEMITDPITLAAHRWRYAKPRNPLPESCLWDSGLQLGVCGDWCGGPKLEGAFLSGQAMAGTLLRFLTIDRPVPETACRAANA